MDANKYLFNLQKSPADPRDFILESIYPETVTLPEVWDLRPYMKSVRDQGQYGTCSAQAVAAMKEWQEYSDIGFKEYMSPWFIYQLRENLTQEGMYPRNTMEILYKTGIVPENEYKYSTNAPITEELKQKAANYKIQGYALINIVESFKKALFANGPCYIAFPVYDPQRIDFWKPSYTGQHYMGGHAVSCVGYLKDCFIIRNSWSVQWGESGYTYYPFKDFGYHWEIWTTIDADSNPENLAKKADNYTCSKNLFRRIFSKKVKK